MFVSGGGRSLAGAPSEEAGKSEDAELAEGVIEARVFGRGHRQRSVHRAAIRVCLYHFRR